MIEKFVDENHDMPTIFLINRNQEHTVFSKKNLSISARQLFLVHDSSTPYRQKKINPDFVRYSNIRSISCNISTFVAVCSAILFPLRG